MMPMLGASRGRYHEVLACYAWLQAVVALVWLATPFGLWSTFGPWAVLVWLLPTTAAVFALAATNKMDGFG